MADAGREHRSAAPLPPRGSLAADVAAVYAAVAACAAAHGQTTPLSIARAAARALPTRRGTWLLRNLRNLGWLRPGAVVPFDVLDGPACPPEFRGRFREVVRLAVFGPPGQGLPYRDKHRYDVYQQLCAEIMREAVDTNSLQVVANRALNTSDVSADPLLSSMLRTFIAEREAALRSARATPAQQYAQAAENSKLEGAFESRYPTRDELLDTCSRLHREFDAYLAQFEEKLALRVLEKLRELRQRYPVHIGPADLQSCEEQYDRLLKRAGAYRRQIEHLAERGAAAARDGDTKTANWVMRRLEAVHALLPNLVPLARLEAFRKEIDRSSLQRESEEAAAELREKKRTVVARIKSLAAVIHRFHEIADRVPPEDNAYRRAELNYQRAIEELRGLNTDWLTGLVLELETLLDDLDDPEGVVQNQLDQFIANVRTALNRLCLEIRARQRRSGATGVHRPPPGAAPFVPPPPSGNGHGAQAPPPA